MDFDKNRPVKVIQSGNVIELLQTSVDTNFPTKRVSRTHYVDLREEDGEAREYSKKSNNRGDNLQTLRRTMRKLRRIINSNFYGWADECMVTITYAENMREVDRVYKDFKGFIRAWRKAFGATEYVVVLEPQARGAWHMHALLKCDGAPTWSTTKEQHALNAFIGEQLWGRGFCTIERMHHVDNVGAYLTAYLTDTEGKKGERLHMYPSGMRIFRKSRGIVKPTEYEATAAEASSLVGGLAVVYEAEYDIKNPTGQVVQHVKYAQYNIRRPRDAGATKPGPKAAGGAATQEGNRDLGGAPHPRRGAAVSRGAVPPDSPLPSVVAAPPAARGPGQTGGEGQASTQCAY